MSDHTLQRRGTALNFPGISQDLDDTQTSDPSSKLVIVMVGLPARGKSYITNKLTRYLNWLQLECRVFNVGNTRRSEHDHLGPSKEPLPDDAHESKANTSHDANFFKPNNKEAFNIREKWAMDTLDQLLDFLLLKNGSVGVFDATNSTKARRTKILNRVRQRNGAIKILYLESICTDEKLILKNMSLKLGGPDYKDMDKEVALQDFKNRLKNYESAYQTIDDEEELQYIKIINVGKKIITYNIHGFLPSQTIYYLLNFNLSDRQIWITRNGESKGNLHGKIGGDYSLTNTGDKFAKALSKFVEFKKTEFLENFPTASKFYNVWTSCLKRTTETTKYFSQEDYTIKKIKTLNDLSFGTLDGLSYQELQGLHPQEFQARLNDKLNYRYPGPAGESYLDVINRIKPIINEIERTSENLVIVSHRVVIRILLGYFLNLDKDLLTTLNVPLNHVFLLEPNPFGVKWSLFKFDEKNDWFEKVDDEEFLKVKEKDVEFNKRRYSVVPISSRAPSSHGLPRPDFGFRAAVNRTPSNTSSSSSSSAHSPSSPHNQFNKHGPKTGGLFNPNFGPLNTINRDRIPRSVISPKSSRDEQKPIPGKLPHHPSDDYIDPIIEDVKDGLKNTKLQ